MSESSESFRKVEKEIMEGASNDDYIDIDDTEYKK